MTSVSEYLDQLLLSARNSVSCDRNYSEFMTHEDVTSLRIIAKNGERAKGVLTVTLTSIVYKVLHPDQDVRLHQAGMPNGYSGRSFDSAYITPFLKRNRLPAMSESGWLTRSLEQSHPYTMDYPGKITPNELKAAFLHTQNSLAERPHIAAHFAVTLLGQLLRERETWTVSLTRPRSQTIRSVMRYLTRHFEAKAASQLPVHAMHALIQCLSKEAVRYSGKLLLPLAAHNSADSQSGLIGDIQVNSSNGTPFEGYEIKHGITVNLAIVRAAYEKIRHVPIDRYYILSSSEIAQVEIEEINRFVSTVQKQLGIQLIVNGLIKTIEYNLRILSDVDLFIDAYCESLESSGEVQSSLKHEWNRITEEFLDG